jgi:hypothetical protein
MVVLLNGRLVQYDNKYSVGFWCWNWHLQFPHLISHILSHNWGSVACSSTHEYSLQGGTTSFLEAHEIPQPLLGKESPVKPLDSDSITPSTSELPPPPLTQSSTTLQELLKQDANKQFIPFMKMPVAGEDNWPFPTTAPVVHHTQNYDEGTQGKILEPAKFDSSQERKTEESVDYADVIAAARAAAESADRAVAAARAAAEFARNRTQQIAASTAGNLEDSSGTDLDSDSNDGQDRAPVSTEISWGRDGRPSPGSDFESDDDNNVGPLKEHAVPHGQGAGGTKLRPMIEDFRQWDPQQSDYEPRFTISQWNWDMMHQSLMIITRMGREVKVLFSTKMRKLESEKCNIQM